MKNQTLKNRYSIQQQLGKNAGRRTFLARDLQTQELVVIKLLIFGGNFQWEDLKLFEREAQTLQMLSHSAIPRYLDYFDVETKLGKGFALVQSYIPAKSLEDCLKDGRTFSEAEVKQIARSLLEILCYLHGQQPQVIHRDIKPSNILLENRSGNSVGQVYLVDFGSVQTLAAKKGGTITVVGTYGYMPPEQFGGRTVPASDLYSLGATLIYLVTGLHPAELSQENLQLQFESATHLNSDFVDWLKWMTEPSLNRRLNSPSKALNALDNPRPKVEISRGARLPKGSRIKLNIQGKNLEIFIPFKQFDRLGLGRSLLVLPLTFIITFMPFLLLILLSAEGSKVGSVIAVLMVFLFVLFPVGAIVGGLLWLLWRLWLQLVFRSIRLTLKPQQISVAYKSPWGERHEMDIPKKNILQARLLYNRLNRFVKLALLVREQHNLLDVGYLTAPEVDWLSDRLSEYLGLSVLVEDC